MYCCFNIIIDYLGGKKYDKRRSNHKSTCYAVSYTHLGYQVFGKEETLSIYEDELVKEIAKKYDKTTRQIAMKFLIQNGISIITRPMEKQWMQDNLNLFDFQLTKDEINYLNHFDMLEYNTKPSQDYNRTVDMLCKFK